MPRFDFAFDPGYRLAAAVYGVRPGNAWVDVDERAGTFTARYGPWLVRTPLDNVRSAQLSGPYQRVKTLGPARLSFADRGLTMASNGRRGVCIEFAEPVPGIEPTGRLRHPGLTVTVADCDGLLRVLRELRS